MKRSEINNIICENKRLCNEARFYLPIWADWTPEDWAAKGKECAEIKDNCLGWDITDFGSGDFAKVGLSLFTMRNGNPALDHKPYCEKIMMIRDGQITPAHFHWNKMEDIIFREGDGEFCMKLWNADLETEALIPDTHVFLKVDGIVTEFEPGKLIRLRRGKVSATRLTSITLFGRKEAHALSAKCPWLTMTRRTTDSWNLSEGSRRLRRMSLRRCFCVMNILYSSNEKSSHVRCR